MLTFLTVTAHTAAATSAVTNEWLILACVVVTLFLAFGIGLMKKAARFNKKHHIIEFDEGKEIEITWNEPNNLTGAGH